MERIGRAMNPTKISPASVRRGNYSVVPYQSTHNTGGTIMGSGSEDERRQPVSSGLECRQSLCRRRLGVPAKTPPTIQPVWSARWLTGRLEAITKRYIKNPGPLMPV